MPSYTIDYNSGTYAHIVLGEEPATSGAQINISNVPTGDTPVELTLLIENQSGTSFDASTLLTWAASVRLTTPNFSLLNHDSALIRITTVDHGVHWFGTVDLFPGGFVRITGDTMTGQLIQNLDGIVGTNIKYGAGPYTDGDPQFSSNTIFGVGVMGGNTTGDRNTAFGAHALSSNNTGYANVAVGNGTMTLNGSGFDNVAVGSLCAPALRSSSGNVAIGRKALQYADTSTATYVSSTIFSDGNTIIGAYAANRIDYDRYYEPMTESVKYMAASDNVIIGNSAVRYASSAVSTVIVGYKAGIGVATSTAKQGGLFDGDIAIGAYALARLGVDPSTTGAIGGGTGGRARDIAIGFGAGCATGPVISFPTSDTSQQLYPYETNGIAIGTGAMFKNGMCSSIAIGERSMGEANQFASQNIVIGNYAGYNLSGGTGRNVLIGNYAANYTTTGVNNVCVGDEAGQVLTTGSNNTLIGKDAGSDPVAIIQTQSNYVVIGNNSTTNANIKVSWTVTSDARDKTDIVPIPRGLDFVNQLNPRQFKLMDRETQQATTGDRYGFVAQEVQAVEGNDLVLIDNSDDNNLKIKESLLVPILTKAIQELSSKLDHAVSRNCIDISAFLPATLIGNNICWAYPASTSMTISSDDTSWRVLAAPLATRTFVIRLNNSVIGTIQFEAGNMIGQVLTPWVLTLERGDVVTLVNQEVAGDALDMCFSMLGHVI